MCENDGIHVISLNTFNKNYYPPYAIIKSAMFATELSEVVMSLFQANEGIRATTDKSKLLQRLASFRSHTPQTRYYNNWWSGYVVDNVIGQL